MKQKSDIHVFVWNMSEDIWPFISTVTTPALKQYEIVENDLYADREYLTFPELEVSVFIAPQIISPEFVHWIQSVVRKKQEITVLVPTKNTGRTSYDARHDSQLLKQLLTLTKEAKKVIFHAYSSTPELLELVRYLRSQGRTIEMPESPLEEDYWTVNFFGSKSGIRQLTQRLSSKLPCHMAEGFIAYSLPEAAGIATEIYFRKGGVVLKTNKAHSGSGVAIYPPGSLPKKQSQCLTFLEQELSKEQYWQQFPIAVEEFIQVDTSVAGGNPNIEFMIDEKGRVKHTYSCGMRVDSVGSFGGVEVGNISLPRVLERQMVRCGKILGKAYKEAGYRGYYDVDFIYGTDNKLYIAESNVRRTGGTYVYAAATKLVGKKNLKQFYFVSTVFTFSQKSQNLSTVFEKMGDTLYSPAKKEGVIVASENLLKVGRLMYIVVAANKTRAETLERRMQQLLSD